MLRADKNIFAIRPPFLVVLPTSQWKIAARIFPHPDGLLCVEPFYDGEPKVSVYLGRPWHVADEVWELEYGVQIMTLDVQGMQHHPALALWHEWVQHCANNDIDTTLPDALARARGAVA